MVHHPRHWKRVHGLQQSCVDLGPTPDLEGGYAHSHYFRILCAARPVIRAGTPGSTGVLEISDMIFSTRGPGTPSKLASESVTHFMTS